MNKTEKAVCIGFARMGADICTIIKAFPYWEYQQVEKIIYNIKNKHYESKSCK